MNSPLVSVIVPVYNGRAHLPEAIQSVFAQTYPRWELILVEDASPDPVDDIVASLDDPRVRYIVHEENRGGNAARDTGIREARGEILAFLDQDDRFHPEKLRLHVDYLQEHPEVGATYNDRFELHYGRDVVREIWQPPSELTLHDVVLGFPLAPSDLVLRTEWARRVGGWGQEVVFHGGETVFLGNLLFEGCRFGYVPRALNYRRHHPQRVVTQLRDKCAQEIAAQEYVFTHAKCPDSVRARRPEARRNTYLVWATLALRQGETETGQELLREAVRLDPTLVHGTPCPLVRSWVRTSTQDETVEHVEVLESYFAQLPAELIHLTEQLPWAIAQGYLHRGLRALLWEGEERGYDHLRQAQKLGACLDEPTIASISHELLNYSREFGAEAGERVLRRLEQALASLGAEEIRRLSAQYYIDRAFVGHRSGQYGHIVQDVVRAVIRKPRLMANRGVVSIFVRALLRRLSL